MSATIGWVKVPEVPGEKTVFSDSIERPTDGEWLMIYNELQIKELHENYANMGWSDEPAEEIAHLFMSFRGFRGLRGIDADEYHELKLRIGDILKQHSKSLSPASPDDGKQAAFCYVIPGDDTANANGFIDAHVSKHGEFTKPLYSHPHKR